MAVATAQASTDALIFTISEQTGDKRTLVLTERALPYRPIEFAGEQGAEFTKYPGNPIRSLQVLGAEEDPTEISGFWKDRFIGATPNGTSRTSIAYVTQNGQATSLLTVVDLVALADDIRRKGQEVVVQWGPEVRKGLLKRFSRKWHNIHDAEWTMRFEWRSQNDPEVPATLAKDTDNANVQSTLQVFVNKLLDAINTPLSIAADRISIYTGLVSSMSSLVDQLFSTTSNALDTVMPIVDQQRRLAGILSSISDQANALADKVSAIPSEVQVSPSGADGSVEGATLAVESFNRQLTTTARDVKFAALNAQHDILKSLSPNLVSIFKARGNTDLRDVSTEFYQTPDEWRSLMVFNGMTDSFLSSGDTVFVPKLLRPLDGSQ